MDQFSELNFGSNAYGIAFDGANMWVANELSNTVTKLAQAGTEVPIINVFPYKLWRKT